MKVGDKVLVSPDLTMLADWTPATVIEVENNPFIGIVISAKTDKGVIFFGQEDLFKPLKRRGMFAISFDMVISNLKKHYGEPYNNAYFEIKEVLRRNGFNWVQGSTYLTESDDLGNVIKAIMDLSKIDWFKKSVRDIRGYKVENWSDFTDIVKNA